MINRIELFFSGLQAFYWVVCADCTYDGRDILRIAWQGKGPVIVIFFVSCAIYWEM